MSVTYTFSPNTKIKSSEVNQDFTDVSYPHDVIMAEVDTEETETNTSYDDMTTPGPAVSYTAPTTCYALVLWSCYLTDGTLGNTAFMSFAISGATTLAAADTRAVRNRPSGTAGQQVIGGGSMYLATLSSGVNTFTSKYRVEGGTGTFGARKIVVIPLGPV